MSSVRQLDAEFNADPRPLRHVRVAIVGAGFAGIGAAIALQRAGIEFAIFERSRELGGTWRDNTYPGCKCDVPSHLYSFSFALNPDWTRTYSSQREIQEYLQAIAQRFDIVRHVRFNHELIGADWNEDQQVWRLETSGGPLTANFLISGCGALSEPALPSLTGLPDFQGVAFHSAAWNHDYDLADKRVAVIGTGASAIQFVPQIQPRVRRLYQFQRTPPWILPHPDRPIPAGRRALYRRFPLLQRLARWSIYWTQEMVAIVFTRFPHRGKFIKRHAQRHLGRQISDPVLRAKLTPAYEPGCKRILISNDYYPAIAAPNAELITEPISRVGARSIVTADGREREIDALIFGTGFQVTDNPMAHRIRGRHGRSLADVWADGAQAHRGTTAPGFPNLFLMTGPNTGIGHTSLLVMIEAQLPYIVECLRHLERRRLVTFEVRADACQAFNDSLGRRMQRTVWLKGGCISGYLDRRGRNTTLWPDFTWKYRRLMRRFDARNYLFTAQQKSQPPRLEDPSGHQAVAAS
ncbi:MAG TPA: NAD(P)/FAD-dependent oxidoreductase [Pirellulales bacterium]|nr:NAD(P)/FAD-dependent oxidoreductase [Pirellulales bacterium]